MISLHMYVKCLSYISHYKSVGLPTVCRTMPKVKQNLRRHKLIEECVPVSPDSVMPTFLSLRRKSIEG